MPISLPFSLLFVSFVNCFLVGLSVCLSLTLSPYVRLRPVQSVICIHLSTVSSGLSICLSVCLSIYLSVCLSVPKPPVCLCCLLICVSANLLFPIYPYVLSASTQVIRNIDMPICFCCYSVGLAARFPVRGHSVWCSSWNRNPLYSHLISVGKYLKT